MHGQYDLCSLRWVSLERKAASKKYMLVKGCHLSLFSVSREYEERREVQCIMG